MQRTEIRGCCIAYEKPGLRCAPARLGLLFNVAVAACYNGNNLDRRAQNCASCGFPQTEGLRIGLEAAQ
jgi:hypothetical protein